MASHSSHPPLWQVLPPLVLGGAGFSYQSHPDPASLPIRDVIKQAFDHGMRAIDTSPFYEPSEQLFGEALADPEITAHYSRSDYIIMTKVGRVGALQFDYSPKWVRQSVLRSLERLRTSYLDVVFCHDLEFVTDDDVISAVGELLELVREGIIRYIGLSSYRIDLLASRVLLVQERFGRPVDVIQNWGQMTLQNSRLESEGLQVFQAAGVSCVCNSSPLAIGLLRSGGVPQGKMGDFHPAPPGLRKAAQDAADYVTNQGDSLAAVALRYALWRAQKASHELFSVSTITGITTLADLTENIEAAQKVLKEGAKNKGTAGVILDSERIEKDLPLYEGVKTILGSWVDYSFTTPPRGWSTELKCVVEKATKSNL